MDGTMRAMVLEKSGTGHVIGLNGWKGGAIDAILGLRGNTECIIMGTG